MTDIYKIRMMTRELVAKLGIDNMMSLANPNRITREQLSRAADAIMHRHKPHREDEQHE
jgi:hypothetical protein